MKKHIVIIEDDRDILSILTYLLEDDGYQVTGLTALCTLEELIELNADCFILDEQLPFVSGHIICIMLKSKPQTKNVPVILASAVKDLQAMAIRCKADAFFEKPFSDISELTRIVALKIGDDHAANVV